MRLSGPLEHTAPTLRSVWLTVWDTIGYPIYNHTHRELWVYLNRDLLMETQSVIGATTCD